MPILKHTVGLVVLIALFVLGMTMVEYRNQWAHSISHGSISSRRLCNFFMYGGRIFQWMGALLGFLEAVAVTILVSGWLIDLAVGP